MRGCQAGNQLLRVQDLLFLRLYQFFILGKFAVGKFLLLSSFDRLYAMKIRQRRLSERAVGLQLLFLRLGLR